MNFQILRTSLSALLVFGFHAPVIAASLGVDTVAFNHRLPQVAFAASEIQQALAAKPRMAADKVRIIITASLPEANRAATALAVTPLSRTTAQSYGLRRQISAAGVTTYVVLGADPTGAMYGGLDVAEAVREGRLASLPTGDHAPYIARRGIKFNIPLDARTPSYSDAGDSAQQNIPEVWSMDFWHEYLDEMARDRFNVLTLWNLHPFPSMVKVAEYPDVALDDVKRTTEKFDSSYDLTGADMVRPSQMAHLETVKKITIDQKILFWRQVMQYAQDRGIEVYLFTWNVFTWGADGKYGITSALNNPITIDYFRKSVRAMLLTYPLLAGIGLTAGEHMPGVPGAPSKEQWLWQTYGEGILDAKKIQPHRSVRLIYRFLQQDYRPITAAWKDYPDTLDFSLKYSLAHMYSSPTPPFALKALADLPANHQTWLTVRNDDIYSFRWGDPDYARAFIHALPGPDKLAGYYMGPDGYTWGREYISTEPDTPRQLVLKKQWLSFMLWGRLTYDPSLPDTVFAHALAARFPEAPGATLLAASRASSKIIPQVTRFFWVGMDYQWFPEACTSHPKFRGFYTVKRFMDGVTMPGSGIRSISEWRDSVLTHAPMTGITPLQVADNLQEQAQQTQHLLNGLPQKPRSKELRLTLGDYTAVADLGEYYAEKIRGAADLALFDKTGQSQQQASAVTHLEAALSDWKKYAAVAARQYRPQLLTRIGYVDLHALTANVEQDVATATSWKAAAIPSPVVSLVCAKAMGAPAEHGLEAIEAALRAKGVSWERVSAESAARGKFIIVAGHMGSGAPEALVIRKTSEGGRPAWVVNGSDDRGLMYAEYDVADRIGWSADPAAPLSEVRATSEKPAVGERTVELFTMNRAYWESRFYNEDYWAHYLDTVARNRFNTISLIFGYENGGFLAPCYPYFFDVDGYPNIHMVGLAPEQQARNMAALNRFIQMAHERGLNVTIGIWDHIYRGNVQGGGVPDPNAPLTHPTPGLVWGMTAQNLIPYTKAALTKFLRLVPGIDTVQFRMHEESGLTASEQPVFWHEIFQTIEQTDPSLHLDLRAKGLADSTIQDGLHMGLHLRISTKYWMEQMGLPFHPTHINVRDQQNRRHSYADMLRYPQTYKIHWELWNGGTSRILLWGDPDYARRFIDTVHLYDGDGFTVDEPLATKMEGQPHDMPPFALLGEKYRYYDYEFERYWHFFQVFGRLGYDPATPDDVWQREFIRRFGPDAAPFVEQGLHRASGVLPRIIASSYPYGGFPMTSGWVEKQHMGSLSSFASTEGTDIAQFEGFDEEAQRLLAGGETAKTRPQETSQWFAQTAQAVQTDVAEAEKRIGTRRNKEFDSTMVDLKILADLALYHSRRIPAAVNYRLYVRDHDTGALDAAISDERSATDAWRQLVTDAGDVYADDLMMGARSRNLCGHWKDELAAMETGLAALDKERQSAPAAVSAPGPRYQPAPEIGDGPVVTLLPVLGAAAGKALTVTVSVRAPHGVKWVRLRYRSVNQTQDFHALTMTPADSSDVYHATIPAADVVPTWDLMYYIEVMDNQGQGRIFPDLLKETPYMMVHLTR